MDNTVLQLEQVSKYYASGKKAAVSNVSFSLERGALLALVGQSGSGKTTLLRIIAGLEQPEQGVVWLSGKQIVSGKKAVPPHERGIGLLFQDYALFPHLTLYENIAFGLKGLSRQEESTVVHEMLSLVNLHVESGRYPHELSGGQQQRVALARALAPKPAILLLDEPFSNLDAILREQVRDEVRQIIKKTGTSTILVTHDVRDALSTADQIAVMYQGKLLQIDEPQAIYNAPVDEYVAQLFGRFNVLKIKEREGNAETAFGRIPLSGDLPGDWEKTACICFRPEQAVLTNDTEQALTGIVQACSFCGDKWTIRLAPADTGGLPIYLDGPVNTPLPAVGEKVNFRLLRYRQWRST